MKLSSVTRWIARPVFAVLIFALCAIAVRSDSLPGDENLTRATVIDRVRQSFERGEISFDEKSRLVILAIRFPERLLDEYRVIEPGDSPTVKPGRCATPAILEIYNRWDELSDDTKKLYTEAFDRPEAQRVYISPSGYFKMHYDVLGPQAVPVADQNGNSVPDFVEKCAVYCDSGRVRHLELGYQMPPSDSVIGGDSLYDIYFQDLGTSLYGYTVPEGDGPEAWNDAYSYIVLHRNFQGFPPNDDPEGSSIGSAKVTAAHEFHHAVQYAYDCDEDVWFMEFDATHFEELVFDYVNDNLNYLSEFMEAPEVSLMREDNHWYSIFIWGLYLDQQYGPALIRSAWEGCLFDVSVFDALADSLLVNHGLSLDDAMAEFCVWNYITGDRDDGLHYEEASTYPMIELAAAYDSYPLDTTESPNYPEGYASCYVGLLPGGETGTLRLSFDGADSREWAAYIIKSTASGVHEYERIDLDTVGYAGEIDIENFEAYALITLVGVNTSEYSSEAAFEYSAHMVSPYLVSSQVVTTDSVVYSGNWRDWLYEVTNPGPLEDIYDLIFWDDSGWVSLDTVDVYVPSGSSRTRSVTVHPPVGTPLGTVTTLRFRAVSRNDPFVYDTQSAPALIVLQRGDVDFSGMIDIGDLTVLIDHLFINQGELRPEYEAGNFDCSGIVDIGDLTLLINHLFIEINCGSPCNPY